MTLLAQNTSHDVHVDAELELLIREARRRQRRRRLLAALAVALAGGGAYLGASTFASAPRSSSLLARPLHLPSLGPRGRCPVSTGYKVNTAGFAGDALGTGPVRVLIANWGDVLHGRPTLGLDGRGPWHALQTLWFTTPGYNGPFVVRGARLGARGPMEVQPGGTGQRPGSGPLVVPAGPTINTYYTSWRRGHVRDSVTGRLVPTLTPGEGYRTVPGSTWVKSPGCYAWQVDGRGFSEVIVVDALAPAK